MAANEFDVIIVGAGSAGATLAARLSEDATRSVLLLEYGLNYTSEQTTPEMASIDPYPLEGADYPPPPGVEMGPYHHSGLMARRTPAQPPTFLLRGRGTGGSSAVNGLFAIRPTVEDLDGWAAAGARGWSFGEALPLLRRMETDLDYGTADYHGDAGPIPIGRPAGPDFLPVDEAFREASLAAGHPWAPDHNAPRAHGLSPYAFNGRYGRRYSTNDAYLEPARGRPNLTICGNTIVDKVLFTRGRAVGVSALADGALSEYRAQTVVLSAGAVHSPAILLRSGIGPAADLRGLGIDVVSDRPAGAGVQDHPLISLVVRLQPGAHGQKPGSRHSRYVIRYGLGLTAEPTDGMLCLLSHAGAPDMCEIFGWLNRTLSQGKISLASADPREHPVVEQDLLSDPRDMSRMLAMIADMVELSRHPALARVITSAHLAPGPGDPVGLPLLDRDVSEAELTQYVLANLYDAAHISGSCRMGAAGDPASVVDEQGRVLGVDGLRVADASIFPWVPSANTHLSSVLVGEKIADLMRGGGAPGAAGPAGSRQATGTGS